MPWKNEAVLKRRDIFEIDPRKIEVQGGWNPRTDFSGEDELKLSIIENGVLEPLTVKAVGERVILVDGERRLRATLLAIMDGHEIVSVPAMLARRGISDIEAMFTALIKNDGKPLSPVEEADAFRRLAAWGVTQADIAKRIGRSQPYVSGRLVLVDAAPEVRKAVTEKKVKIKAAKQIIKKSGGSVERQRQELKDNPKQAGNGFKPMSATAIEKLLMEHRGTLTVNMNEYAKAFNQGIITGLSMVLFNSPEIKKEWIE